MIYYSDKALFVKIAERLCDDTAKATMFRAYASWLLNTR